MSLVLQAQDGRGVSGRSGVENAANSILDDPFALGVSHSFKADVFHFEGMGVEGGGQLR